MAANDVVRARIDPAIKDEAAAVLKDMGLTVSDLVRIVLTKVAREHRVPFELKAPNAASRAAIAEANALSGGRFGSADALFDDLEKPTGR